MQKFSPASDEAWHFFKRQPVGIIFFAAIMTTLGETKTCMDGKIIEINIKHGGMKIYLSRVHLGRRLATNSHLFYHMGRRFHKICQSYVQQGMIFVYKLSSHVM
ncbi:uncharacterized protein LOC133778218 [Humulus lupulus]|uniref:uncharacterized protein LOC133778218 n=1 Tax=Humulus lupulus TaxID=3486 RepID=UPI002B414F2A|nr:uncharacterized protein LOC133778218 [Humulus lupulus]